MRRGLVIGGIAAAAAAAYAWYARSPGVREPIFRTARPHPARAPLPLGLVAPMSASVAPAREPSLEPELIGDQPREPELAEVPAVSREPDALEERELAPGDSDEMDETRVPVAATDVRIAGEPLGWLVTAPSPWTSRRRRTRLGALAHSRPRAALGGAILLNLGVAAALAATTKFDAVADWFTAWLSVLF